jgi:outer membrane protein assembly factor BamB
MLSPGAVIGCNVSNSLETNACEACGHENPAGCARWCGVCGVELPAAAGAPTRGMRTESGPSPDRPFNHANQDAGITVRGWMASGPLRLAVPVLIFAVLSAVALVTGRDRLAEPAADANDDVEFPAADALAPSDAEDPETAPPEQSGPVRDIAPGAVVWADRVTADPLSSTSDLEVAGGLIITAERSPEETEEEIAADVFAVDAMTGEQVWKNTVMAPWFPATPPGVAVADRWVILVDCAQLTGLDLADGEVVWQHRTDRVILLNDVAVAPRDDPEVILVITSNRSAPRLDWVVTAIDVLTGEILWNRDVVRAAATPHAAVVLNEDGRVSGLAAATGEPMWEITPDDPPSDLYSVAGAILETDDLESTRGRLRAATDGRLLFDDEVHRHGLAMPGRNEVEHRSEVVTTAAEVALIEDGEVSWAIPQPHAQQLRTSRGGGHGPARRRHAAAPRP